MKTIQLQGTEYYHTVNNLSDLGIKRLELVELVCLGGSRWVGIAMSIAKVKDSGCRKMLLSMGGEGDKEQWIHLPYVKKIINHGYHYTYD